jgi:hypothetical protein
VTLAAPPTPPHPRGTSMEGVNDGRRLPNPQPCSLHHGPRSQQGRLVLTAAGAVGNGCSTGGPTGGSPANLLRACVCCTRLCGFRACAPLPAAAGLPRPHPLFGQMCPCQPFLVGPQAMPLLKWFGGTGGGTGVVCLVWCFMGWRVLCTQRAAAVSVGTLVVVVVVVVVASPPPGGGSIACTYAGGDAWVCVGDTGSIAQW